jgi:hypothetical protein
VTAYFESLIGNTLLFLLLATKIDEVITQKMNSIVKKIMRRIINNQPVNKKDIRALQILDFTRMLGYPIAIGGGIMLGTFEGDLENIKNHNLLTHLIREFIKSEEKVLVIYSNVDISKEIEAILKELHIEYKDSLVKIPKNVLIL